MPYDKLSFLSGVAAGRNMESWPAFDAVDGMFSFIIDTQAGGARYYSLGLTIDPNNSGVTISWGDGSTQSGVSGTNGHTYSVDGIYIIIVVGLVKDVSFSGFGGSLLAVNSPIPADPDATLKRNYLSNMFKGCSNLQALPKGLFHNFYDNHYVIYNIESVFDGCSSLRKVPDDLFEGATLLTPFDSGVMVASRMFAGCSALSEVPAGLFSNSEFGKIQVAEEIFAESGLEEIPDHFFSTFTICTRFNDAFSKCTHLRKIGDNIFDGCQRAVQFRSIFRACHNLTDIGKRLFSVLNNASVFSYAFSGCYSLETLPADLFDMYWSGSPNFDYCFYEDSGITSEVPELWLYYPNSYKSACFSGCTNAANYNDIPNAWK